MLLPMGFFKKLFGGGEPKLDRKDIGAMTIDGEKALIASNVFVITGRGFMLLGEALREISVGDAVTLLGHDGNPIQGVETTSVIEISHVQKLERKVGVSMYKQDVPLLYTGEQGGILVATPTPTTNAEQA